MGIGFWLSELIDYIDSCHFPALYDQALQLVKAAGIFRKAAFHHSPSLLAPLDKSSYLYPVS